MSEVPYLPDYQMMKSSKEKNLPDQQEFLIKEIGGNTLAIALNPESPAASITDLTSFRRKKKLNRIIGAMKDTYR